MTPIARFAVISSVLFTLAPSAGAASLAYFPGDRCVEPLPPNLSTLYHWYGSVYNTGPNALTMVCPMDNDPQANHQWYAYVIDQHPSEDVSCSFRRQSINGDYLYFNRSSTGAKSTAQALWGGTDNPSGYNLFFVVCSVPGAYGGAESSIRGFYMLNQ